MTNKELDIMEKDGIYEYVCISKLLENDQRRT